MMAEKKFQPSVDKDLCKACGYCAFQCPKQLFQPSGQFNAHGYDYMVINEENQCIGCLKCIASCPDFAITVTEL